MSDKLKLTPPEAASVLLSKTHSDVGYFSRAVAGRLERSSDSVRFDPKHAQHWQALFTDAERSQRLVNRVSQVLSARSIDQLTKILSPKELLIAQNALLSDSEETVVRLRFGIEHGRIGSYDDIGIEIQRKTHMGGWSKETARQTELGALRKLKRLSYSNLWVEFLPQLISSIVNGPVFEQSPSNVIHLNKVR